MMRKITLICLCTILLNGGSGAQRSVDSLNGPWDVEEGVLPDVPPSSYDHKVIVPGLISLANPRFENAGQFESLEYLKHVRTYFFGDSVPDPTLIVGKTIQQRNFFWYRKRIMISKADNILLKINKAMFGIAAYVNGHKVGESDFSFSSSTFEITPRVIPGAWNEIILRIGAHPLALSASTFTGTDQEKMEWMPGIYDEVKIISCSNPYIEWVQTAPDIDRSTITSEVKVKNMSGNRIVFRLENSITSPDQDTLNNSSISEPIKLDPGESRIMRSEIAVKNAKLWTPETPALYYLETTTGGDCVRSRFGMRKFTFDTKTKKAYLNNQIYYLRGSNICLFRFFEDPDCGDLPWNEQWVRRLLSDIPKSMNWNGFRFCIGPVPERWLEIADETGLIIQNEFPIWRTRPQWDTLQLRLQVENWMRDNWNHPSVGWWDICNETNDGQFNDIIGRVRDIDLSKRLWESGYNLPQGPDDPVEDHPYHFISFTFPNWEPWSTNKYSYRVAPKSINSAHPTAHAVVNNEYGWLWLHRSGEPTLITKKVFDYLCPGATNEQRIQTAAQYLAGETEYFRAHRNFAGIFHFTLLSNDHPNALTGDLFRNVKNLEIHPPYLKALREAFKPLGVSLNFWRDSVLAGEILKVDVMLLNDTYRAIEGKLLLTFEQVETGKKVEETKEFKLPDLGQQTVRFEIHNQSESGNYILKATAFSDLQNEPTICIRKTFVDMK